MASKQVQEMKLRLLLEGFEGLDKLKSSFRGLEKAIGPTEQTIEKARQSIIEFGEAGNKSEQLIKGQIEAFKGLRSQATQGGKVYKELTADIKKLEGAAYGASPAVEAQRKALTALGLSADATASQIDQAINSLINLRGEVRVDSQAFDNFGKSIAQLTDRFRAVNQEAQNFAQAQQRIARPIGATSAAARQQIRDLDLVTESLREQRDFLGALEGEERIKAGAAGLAERGAPAAGRRTFEEVVSESAFGGDIKKLLPAKDIKAALDEVAREIADFQQQIETKLSRKIQISFQETARAGRESARAMAAAFSDPELINVFNKFDKRLGELPDTTTGLNQGLSELSERLVNTKRNTVDYLAVAMQMAGVQRELTAVTQGYAQSLLMGIRTGTVAPSARNLQEVITALRAEMSQLDVTTSEGARAYAENAREARSLEQQLKGLADAYRHVGDMAAQAATAETSAATARITANYLNRPLIRQQEQAMAELGQRARAGVAATPLALPAAGQTTAPGTGLPISGEYVQPGRVSGRVQRVLTPGTFPEERLQGPELPPDFADRARRAAISQGDAVRDAAEATEKAERQVESYRAEIDKARKADIGSIESTQRLRGAIDRYRSTLPGASAEFKKLTKELGELDARSEKLGRGLARRRMTGMQMTQAAGAALSGGIFGGPEGFLGGAIGSAFGVGGAFAGAAIGAQIGGLRQQLGGFADYAAQIQKMKIALDNAAGSQDQFNQAMAAASAATRNLNVPQDVAIQGMTKLTAAVKGAGGQVSDAELVFNNVTAAIKATGGSAQDVDGAITAMVQVFSKGKVSAEELSGQLGERLPGAVTKFAEANNMSLPALQKALEQGEVGLNELMNFIIQLGDEYSDVAKKIAGSSQDAGARLTVAYNKMRIEVGKALQPIGAAFQEAFIPFIEQITPVLVDVLPKIGKLALALAKNFDTVAVAAAAFGTALFAIKFKIITTGIAGISAAIAGIVAPAKTATAAVVALNGAIAANPAGIVAAGVAALGVAFYNAWKETQKYKDMVQDAGESSSDIAKKIAEVEAELKKAKEKAMLTGGAIHHVGFESKKTTREVELLEKTLAQLKPLYKIKIELEQIAAGARGIPEGYRIINGRLAYKSGSKWVYFDTAEEAKKGKDPSTFPNLAGDEPTGKTKKERESQLPQLMAQLAVRKQIAEIDERINGAELMGNKLLQIRLEGEKQIAQLVGRYQAIQFEKIHDDDKKIKRLLVMEDIERARLDIAQKLAMAAREVDKDITKAADELKESYENQIRLEELVGAGMTEALAKQYIEIEKIIDKQRERYEEEIRYREAIVALGGPGAAEAEAGIDLFRERLAGLGGRETELKGLAGATEVGKIQEFIKQAEDELKDFEAMAVRISEGIGNAIGSSISNGIAGLIEGTTTAKEIFADFLKDVGRILIQEGAKMIATYVAIGIAKAFAGLTSGGSGSSADAIPSTGNPAGATVNGFDTGSIANLAADGAYFAGGKANFAHNNIQPFANGGIVTKPTFFKYADGGTFSNGVMGEAGPEAIMPLKRGADGKLGVAARLDGAMKRYRATPGSAAAVAEGDATAGGGAAGATMEPIDVRYSVERINSVDYVTADQFQAGMRQAAQQGAQQGERRALTTLRQNTSQRKRIGI